MIQRAILSRAVETRLLDLFSEGKLDGTVHTCIGQEFVGAALAEYLRETDALFSTHRCHGHFLSWIGDVDGLVAELMGRATGICGGRGGSQHLHAGNFFSSGIQGGIMPSAAGRALASVFARDGRVAVAIIGDGTLGEGIVYETMNLAALWQLPLIVVLEDNGYAQSTPKAQGVAGDIIARAESFGIRAWRGNTWEWESLCETMGEVFAHVRQTPSPAFVLVETYRLKAHSKGDDLRSLEELAHFESIDPLTRLTADRDAVTLAASARATELVDEAVRLAAVAPSSKPQPAEAAPSETTWRAGRVRHIRLLDSVNETLHAALARDERIIVIGEDIEDPYGGAFKITKGLSDAFPGRVRNTPISEAGIVGVGTGLALSGYRPLVEIMFGDFVGLAFDQLVNHAAKFERMYGLSSRVNLIVRTPMGGRRGYGPTHSQSLERHFFGAPGLRIVALNSLMESAEVYGPLLSGSFGPTLVIENKVQYGLMLRGAPDGFDLMLSHEPLPTAWLRPQADEVDVTFVGYGGMSDLLVSAAEQAFDDDDLVCQVLCPTQIAPFDVGVYRGVFARTRSVVIVEEGQGFAGFGAEVSAQIASRWPALARRVRRIAAVPDVVPASKSLEQQYLPGVDALLRAAREAVL